MDVRLLDKKEVINMRTAQIISQSKPSSKENVFSFGVYCDNCGTGRVFRIQETIRLLTTRFTRLFTVKTECEKCGHKISASIGWIPDRKNYSYNDQKAMNEHNLNIEDDNGLDTIVL